MSPGAYTVTTQNPPHWCNATSEPYMVVSTEDARSEGLAMIYPNPVTQTLYIQWGKSALEPTELVLTDLSGKVLYHTYVEAPLPYEVFPLALPSTVASGTYLLLLRTATAQLREKIVVER
jgi:hypothetical protein